MPELPEVEVLVRALRPLLVGRAVRAIEVRRHKILRPTSPAEFERNMLHARFEGLDRRGKYLLFRLSRTGARKPLLLVGHLGMTGRMYLAPRGRQIPKHAAVVLDLGTETFIFEDTRYFGRMTLDSSTVAGLGPEPLGPDFTEDYLRAALRRSGQPIKVKLLDQRLVAGLGNIYASEALFRAEISPKLSSRRLNSAQIKSLRLAVREVLAEAIRFGSTVPLDYSGRGERDGLFYFGATPGARRNYVERLCVYDRANQPCPQCEGVIKRVVQAGRSTFYCPRCQKSRAV